ncbi:S9 family peptidase [Gramella sp. KN1008]|uniref:alpha/beta hydrolase family protein n=1 Tax=Gramella sp. KN1008 TaxID=2529298 RepID=UPI00103A2C77|nr:alpha/beta hydrolase [Gramella sp. KN1008]TBW28386.1 alpha/beta hydrolase [Gramella sp. KN1008]
MKNHILTVILLILFQQGSSQELNYVEEDLKITQAIEGTLTIPKLEETESLVIFIQGSGPTDRNGNQPMMKNDGMKKIAHQLAKNGIASFRFDKRIFKMTELKIKEEDLRFDDFVNDVKDILKYFEEKDQFDNLLVAGHSQGSLVGILASEEMADGFISLAGAGQPIDNIIVEQIHKMAPPLAENARTAFDEIRETGSTTNYSPMLESIFKPTIQQFMESWMKYDPVEEITKLDIPVLIINGSADIQVETEEAEALKIASEEAKLVIIDNMNHIFRKIESEDRLKNTKSYNEPNLPLHPELIPVLTEFIKELE